MNSNDFMKFWFESADSDYATMKVLYNNKKNTWCLFIGHLVIEKLITTEDYKKVSNPFVKEVVDTGIKVA